MAVTAEAIKELREMTSCGVIECKKALEEAKGDFNKAKEILQKRGLEIAAKKGNREAKEGRVESYIHMGSKIGVLVEVNCETDFVAKSKEFVDFSKDLAMQIAATNPKYIKKESIPADVLKQQPDQNAFIKESSLMEQAYIRDPKQAMGDLLNLLIAKVGENIIVSRFVRFKVGEVE